jgi:AGCS family alanine or glycine:cation symporter
MQHFSDLVSALNAIVWGTPMVVLLFGTHLFLTVRLGFVQRHIFRGIRLSVAKDAEGGGDVSPFGALATALAATIGTGNIFGVAGAIYVGGPGAVLWMWLTGVFGIATKYAEALLSVKYRITTPEGHTVGGPMYVLEHQLGLKTLGRIFAGLTVLASFGIGNMVQSNTLSNLISTVTLKAGGFPHITPLMSGLVMTLLTALVILGGIRSIARVCSWLVPFMAVIYVAGCVAILIRNAEMLPDTFRLIFEGAWKGHAAAGGFAGAVLSRTIQRGIARGLFSNEAGMGSAPIVAAAARCTHPVRQALVSATGTFWDTVVICLLTGLVIVSSGAWTHAESGKDLCEQAFAQLPVWGPFVLTFGLMTFVMSTILGWSYYGERAAEYLFGSTIITPYRLLWVGAVLLGSLAELNLVWNLADTLNALMAVPNLISLLLLSGLIARETKSYFLAHPRE